MKPPICMIELASNGSYAGAITDTQGHKDSISIVAYFQISADHIPAVTGCYLYSQMSCSSRLLLSCQLRHRGILLRW